MGQPRVRAGVVTPRGGSNPAPGFWQNLMRVQLDLFCAGIVPLSVGLRRLADLWVTLALTLTLTLTLALAP